MNRAIFIRHSSDRISRSFSMSSKSVVVFITLAICVGSCYSNYCDPSLCRRGQHIACNAPRGFGQACGKEVKFVPMNANMQKIILNKHNELRAQIARGMYGFPQAARMPTLVWDEEMANIASFNARKCIFAHDQCRNTQQFKYSGQNLAITTYYGMKFTPEDRVVNFTLEWFNEYKDCPPSYVDSYPMNHQGPQIGHFTQIISDRTWKVGCSLTHYITNGKFINYYLVCNYSMTNMIKEPIYKKGKTGSKCETGQNPQYKGLCSPREKVKSESYNG
ncbi:antigen 5 like allergen Cul n 1-like [Ochlerotatus camptorhynchus]|uniref:antigen 5 like allergen Cul n 1-like n=1 Tax=Ochlerotatus camptorhynchus TaxID=644619 RepID=UPI0031DA675F